MPNYKTRSDGDGKYSGVNLFLSLNHVIRAWKEDPSIWKISWEKDGYKYIFISKWKEDLWPPGSEDILESLSQTYFKAGPKRHFWVRQDIPDLGAPAEDFNCFLEVLSDNQLISKYS